MIRFGNRFIVILSIIMLIFASFASAGLASEVTGTLSSDGGSATSQGTVLSETTSQNQTVVGQMTNQNTGQLQGSVTGGREEGASAVLADLSSEETFPVIVPLGLLVLAVIALLLWQRRLV